MPWYLRRVLPTIRRFIQATLFACAAPDDPVFEAALNCFYAGEPDPKTLHLLQADGEP